jgi:hypothetical protein
MVDPIAITSTAIDAADKLGLLDRLKEKLFQQPDRASANLATVLDEMSKIHDILVAELKNYVSLYFDPAADADAEELRREERKALTALEGREIEARMRRARTHSSKINNIYFRFLRPWFVRAKLTDEENRDMYHLFHDLYGDDVEMLNQINKVAKWLSEQAEATLTLVDAGKFEEANVRIKAARLELLPTRREMSRVMQRLTDLESEFTEMSRAV